MQHILRQLAILLEDMGYSKLEFNLPINKQLDSLDITSFVMECEKVFSITISDDEQYNCRTLNDYAILIDHKIHLKRQAAIAEIDIPVSPFKKPTIQEQIDYIDKLIVPQNEHMITAIKENLIAVNLWNTVHARQTNVNSAHGYTEGADL